MTFEQQRQELQSRLDGGKTQEQRNKLGQFSTPYPLAADIMQFSKELMGNAEIRFLEPAVGTGVFISAMEEVFKGSDYQATGFEIDKYYGEPTQQLWQGHKLEVQISDFLQVPVPVHKFNLLVSNPPYSRHHHIDSQVKKELQQRVKAYTGISISGLSGLYCYFLILSTLHLQPGALSVWLIPGEFMDVNYGSAIRSFLLTKVDLFRIHRFRPEDLQFTDALVSSCIVCFRNLPPSDKDIEFTFGGSINESVDSKQIKRSILEREKKWTPLFSQEADSYKGLTIGDFFKVKRGLATGDNDFFLMTKQKAEQFDIPAEFLTPILPSPRYIMDDVIESDGCGIPQIDHQIFLFSCNLDESTIHKKYPKMGEYILLGRNCGVPEGYICSRRTPWYSTEKRLPAPFVVPYMGRGESRKNLFRFILNQSNAIATNVYLMLYPRPEVAHKLEDPQIRIKVWEALNSIPSERLMPHGRVYGGGLHKMEPKELMNAPADVIANILNLDFYCQETLF